MGRTLACLALALTARSVAAQRFTATELDVGSMATWARRDFYGGSFGMSQRPSGQGRAALVVAGGVLGGRAAIRVEAMGQFLVVPGARGGLSPYAGLGMAYVAANGLRGSSLLVALAGIEAAAGGPGGWFAELGVGGGLRVRAGWRWRHFAERGS